MPHSPERHCYRLETCQRDLEKKKSREVYLLKRLDLRIILIALYDDFQNLFGEIEEELSTSKLEDEAEKQLLRYVYLVKRYVEVRSYKAQLSKPYLRLLTRRIA